MEYDHDQLYPAFGFGGRHPTQGVSHCFALNGNPANPAVRGVDGILDACAWARRAARVGPRDGGS